MAKRSATPGRYQTGSTANLVTFSSPWGFMQILPSGIRRPLRTASSSSGTFLGGKGGGVSGRFGRSYLHGILTCGRA